jgi:aryl-alcohol dehydrogenase-like predicted oxidoreductase
MRYRRLGESGLVVSVVGVGCNSFGRRIGQPEVAAVVDAAIDAGVTLFDTSDSYGDSEVLLGRALSGKRDRVVVATKFGSDLGGRVGPDWGARGSRRYVRRAVDSSLQRLGTDWIDLYQLHFPDPQTPIEETISALDDLVREGKVRYIGSSNFAAWQVSDADWVARSRGLTRFVSAQNHYNLMRREVEAELVPACLRHGIGLLPYFPLNYGLLTGRYHRDQPAPPGSKLAGRTELLTPAAFDQVEALDKFASDCGVRLLDVAIGGLAAQPAVGSVIAGATKPEQVQANARAGDWQPDDAQLAALDGIIPSPRPRG